MCMKFFLRKCVGELEGDGGDRGGRGGGGGEKEAALLAAFIFITLQSLQPGFLSQ